MFNLLNEHEDILNKIVFSDKATFTINGEVNSQNFQYALYSSFTHLMIFLTIFLLIP